MIGATEMRRLPLTIICAAFLLSASLLPFAAYAQDSDVVARVNGRDITAADLAVAEELYSQQLGSMPEDAKRSVLVDALIELRVIADAARDEGVADNAQYKRQMAFFEAQTLRSVFMDTEVAAAVTDEAVRAAYDEQAAKIPPIEEVRLRHILLPTKEAADEVIKGLQSGQDFAAIAIERSLDTTSKEKGGDLGFVVAGQTIAEVDAAAASLQPGQFTASAVQSPFGFHVVKVEERRQRPAPAFDTISDQIRQSLQAAEEKRIVDTLRANAKVEKLVPDVAPPAGADDGHGH
jgi:peptidyl-prolyl cis-trans isomerase C